MDLARGTRAALLCVCIVAGAVLAEVNTGGELGVVRTQSAKTLGKGRLDAGVGVEFQQSSDYVKGPTWDLGVIRPDDSSIANVIHDPAKLISADFFLAVGILDFWDLALSLPVYYDWSGFAPANPSDAGLGDLEISAKFMLPPVAFDKVFYSAVLLSVTAPTGMKGNGLFPRHLYYFPDTAVNPAKNLYSLEYATVKPMLLFTFDLAKVAPVQIHLNMGGVLTEVNRQNTVIGALALEYAPKEFITLFAELWAESRWTNLSSNYDIRKDPVWVTPGLKISAPNGMYFYLAGDISLSSKQDSYRSNWDKKGYTYSTGIQPDYGVQFSIGWNGFLVTQDRDHDGVPDNVDRCPDDSGPASNYGCPDPDQDKDGICDPWVAEKHKESKYAAVCKGSDKCPDKPEDIDGFQDDDGCPDPDNDGDGIPDVKDQCPNQPEDFDGFEDLDGCPDYDNDRDGIPDSVDKCPNDPEDIDGFEDKDGCPDLDNDHDGIPDLMDKCPNEPGPASNNGCPDTTPPKPPKKEPDFPMQQTLRGVTFRSSSAEMTFDSYQWLDMIVKAMREYPELEIEVRGYTDSMGKYASLMQLSQMRAEAVRQYLLSQGIGPGRVRAVGYGAGSPIADNRSAAGRALNRRIEIVRVK
ncbi:MAG TPA: OmpA family protein [Chitinivibrionales bacterium]|nr:OmpA family protein [Chitinivibrionales bacterium]